MPGRIHPASKNLRAYVSPAPGLAKDAATFCEADQSWAAGSCAKDTGWPRHPVGGWQPVFCFMTANCVVTLWDMRGGRDESQTKQSVKSSINTYLFKKYYREIWIQKTESYTETKCTGLRKKECHWCARGAQWQTIYMSFVREHVY